MSNAFSISYCIGIYNEEKILRQSVKRLTNNLSKLVGKNNYEIVLVDNGSTDNTIKILKKIKNKHVRWFHLPEKGHGLALRTAVLEARKNYAVVTAIDIPFGFDDLKNAKPLLENGYDIVFGSKAHSKSKITTTLERKIASKIYKFLLKIFFQLPINDPQGSVFFNKTKMLPIIKMAKAKNAFFTTQIAIYSYRKKLQMIEIPVVMNVKKRKSKYNIFRDGLKMFSTMFKEFISAYFF